MNKPAECGGYHVNRDEIGLGLRKFTIGPRPCTESAHAENPPLQLRLAPLG